MILIFSNSEFVVETLVVKVPCLQPIILLRMHLTWYVPYLYLIILVRWLNYKRKILTNIDIHVVIVDPSSDLHIGIFFLQFYISNFHSLYLPLCYEHFYFLFLVQLVFLEDWPGSQFRSSFKFFRKKILMVSHSLTSQVKFAR